MIFSSKTFRYNGIDSEDMKIWNVNLSSGFMEEPFVAEREINEISIKGRDRPYFQEITRSPLEFTLNFAFTEPWNKSLISQIKQWLCQSYYKPLIFSDDISIVDNVEIIDKIYYCIMVSDPKILYNGLNEGYCTLQFRCDSPYAYSPITITTKNCSVNTVAGTTLTINNTGDINCHPKITITKVGDGVSEPDISIINTSNNDFETKFTTAKIASAQLTFTDGVVDGETVSIGDDVFEFDTDNIITTGNIKIDISAKTKTQASAKLTLTDTIKDGELITLGSTIFEVDTDASIKEGNIAIDVSSYATEATNILTFTGVPIDGELITIGKDTYEFDNNNSIATDSIRVDISALTTVDEIITQLVNVINTNTTESISAVGDTITDTITITCIIKGTIGNSISTYKTTTVASWANNTLIGGTDCSIANALTAIASSINNYVGTNFVATLPSPNPNNLINLSIESGGSFDGSLGNTVVCSTSSTGASFDTVTFLGGSDCTSTEGATALNTVINLSATEAISSTNTVDSVMEVKYDASGKIGELSLGETLKNGSWNSETMIGGDGLLDEEVVTLDNERKTISSSLFQISRYDTFNDNYFYLIPGENILTLKGNAIFSFQLEYRFL